MTDVRAASELGTVSPVVRQGAARVRELTPAQRRAVMFAQQQVLKARAARKAKDEIIEARRRMWDEADAGVTMQDDESWHEEPRRPDTPTLRGAIGHVLRDLRSRDHRTLREVSQKAGVSLGYLSEVERGQKEASSELLTSIAESLGVSTAQLLRMVADRLDMLAA